jgi:hypothetical protein
MGTGTIKPAQMDTCYSKMAVFKKKNPFEQKNKPSKGM